MACCRLSHGFLENVNSSLSKSQSSLLRSGLSALLYSQNVVILHIWLTSKWNILFLYPISSELVNYSPRFTTIQHITCYFMQNWYLLYRWYETEIRTEIYSAYYRCDVFIGGVHFLLTLYIANLSGYSVLFAMLKLEGASQKIAAIKPYRA